MPSKIAYTHRLFWILTGLGILGIIALRFYQLGQIPFGLYCDEVSYGYNALSILLTGRDEHGVSFPLLFEAFGEFKKPFLIYLLTPVFALGGVSAFTLRLPSVLISLLAGGSMGWLCGILTRSKKWAVFAAILAGLLPWYFTYSRIAFDAVLVPLFFSLALGFLFLDAQKEKETAKQWPLWAAGFSLSLLLYSYSSAMILVPGTAFAVLLSDFKWFKRFGGYLGGILIGALPLLLVSSQMGQVFQQQSKVYDFVFLKPDLENPLWVWLSQYFAYFSPDFLFLHGDSILRHHTGLGGELYLSLAVPLLAGVITCVQRWKTHWPSRCILLLTFLFPLAGSLIASTPHATRSLHGVVLALVLIVWGLIALKRWIHPVLWKQVAIALFLLGLSVESTRYFSDYFGDYALRSRDSFSASKSESVRVALQAQQRYHSTLYYPIVRINKIYESEPYIYLNLYLGLFGKVPNVSINPLSLMQQRVLPFYPPAEVPAQPNDLLLFTPLPQTPPGWKKLYQPNVPNGLALAGLSEIVTKICHCERQIGARQSSKKSKPQAWIASLRSQ